MTLYLARTIAAQEIYGIDIAPSFVEAARQAGVQAERVDIDNEALPYPDDFFQAIFCGEVLEHLVDPDRLLDEVHRVLSPEGVCVLTTPNLAAWHNRLALLLGAQPFPDTVSVRYPHAGKLFPLPGESLGLHLRVFTYRALREVLARHGFTVVETIGTHLSDLNVPDMFPRRLRALLALAKPVDMLLSRFPSFSSCSVMAIKR
jgi:SAM-dependent methyltransferase